MNNPLFLKLAVIAGIALLLNIPLWMIEGKSSERSVFKEAAFRGIAKSWTGNQTLIGPFLRVPFTVQSTESAWDENLKAYQDKITTERKTLWLTMDKLSVNTAIENDMRYKGIYQTPVYHSTIRYEAEIGNILNAINQYDNVAEIHSPTLSMLVKDPRGISNIPELSISNASFTFEPGSKLAFDPKGLHVTLDKQWIGNPTPIHFTLDVRGMNQLNFVPVAKAAEVKIVSDWPHPSFIGDFSPLERTIDENGYSALWKMSSFATNIDQKVKQCSEGQCEELINESFGVSHIEPVDVYSQTERAIKYAFLFILLSFMGFFLFEVIKGLSIHAVQYGLVGIAIALFYLLLLALSEHLPFIAAYCIATAACVGLLHFYLSAILKNWLHTCLFSALFTLLYGLLYVIIQTQDFALLMGATLTFGVLSALMVLTRHIDWFEVSDQLAKLKPEKPEKPIQENSDESINPWTK